MKINKLALLGLAATMVVSTPVLAASTLKNSVGSVNSADDGTTVGFDESQSKKTEYTAEITADAPTNTVSVYATQASTFSVVIPKTIILDGAKDATNAGKYVVTVKGNIAGNERVTVAPDTAFKMKQTGKDDIDASVTQTHTLFMVKDASTVDNHADTTIYGLDNTDGATENGTVTVSNLSAGSWSGSFNFNISLT